MPRGAPATRELIEQAIAASRDRAPDGVRHVVTAEGVLLVQCMFANTPESVGEQLPLCDPSGRVWIVKRGHLNNIDELRGRLRDRLGSDARVHTDAEVMLSAYLAWGPDMAGKLNGEFTLAIWDARRQALFVLRDHLGLRGCYTHDGPEWYVAASEPSQVLPFPGVSQEMDELAVADFISGWAVDRVRTFYQGVRRPMPATAVTIHGADVDHRMYWMPPPICADRATHPPSHYAPAVLEAFEQAVRSSLRSPTPVVADLSGGLDSSAVMAMAARLSSENEDIPEVIAHSLLYPGLDCDETAYINDVLAKWPIRWHGFDDVTPTDPTGDRARLVRSMRYPVGLRPPGMRAANAWMLEDGHRVRLTGDGGDEVFHTAPLPLTRGLKPPGEWWPYFWWASRRSVPMLLFRARRELIRPHVPERLLRLYLRGRSHEPAEGALLTARAEALRSIVAAEALLGRELGHVDDFWSPGSLFSEGLDDAVTLRHGHELRRPFHDLHLRLLVRSVPLLVHRWDGIWRSLQKETFAALYPNSVSLRRNKAEFTTPQLMVGMPMTRPGAALADRGLVDPATLEQRIAAISRAVQADVPAPFPWDAVAIRDIEYWMHQGHA